MSIAFFDIDGTLLPHPSLERRFFRKLVWQGNIPTANYLRSAAQIVGFSRTGLATAARSTKMYLRGVPVNVLSHPEFREEGWIPEFFPGAIQRAWLHAVHGDRIVLVTGTLAPLAEIVKIAVERELLWRGVEGQVAVFATRLETRGGLWTGCVEGVSMLGEAKAAAAKEFASSCRVPLSDCFAYGDHVSDCPMLQSVGNPVAVNPSSHLRRIARQKGWRMMNWRPCPQRTSGLRQALHWKGEAAR